MKHLINRNGTRPMAVIHLRFRCPLATNYYAIVRHGLLNISTTENQLSIRKVEINHVFP
jgi:hypothetical protein